MSLFDIVLLVLLAGFVIGGLFKGVIKMVGNLVGLVAGAYLASHYYLAAYAWMDRWIDVNENVGKVLAFIILFILIAKLVELAFILVEKAFRIIAFIPGSRFINNILGAALGFLEGGLFLGLIIYVISRYALIGDYFGVHISESMVAPFLLKMVEMIMPLLPEALKALKSVI